MINSKKSRRKKQSKKQGRLQAVTLCISTALVLILLGLVVFTGLVANNLSVYVKENLTVTVIFDGNVSNQQAKVVCNKIRKQRYVSHLDYISKEQALKEQTQALGADPAEFLGGNPFTPSAEIYLHSDYANADSVKWIIKGLKANKQIQEVSYQQDLMNSVNSNLRKIGIVLLVLAVLLSFISFSLISNTVRLGLYARRFTINTMQLVGASWSFIRAPFLKNAVLHGLIAGFVANVALGGCMYALYTFEPDVLTVVTPMVMAITGGSVMLFGVIISTICVYVSLNKFLSMKSRELYKL